MNNLELKESRKKLGLTQTELANLIGRTSMRTVQNWELGVNKVPDHVVEIILKEIESRNTPNFVNEPPADYSLIKGVPYYDVEFTSSFLELDNNQQTIPNSYINHPFFTGCDLVIRNSGQSMAKVIAHGDAIGLIRLYNWQEFFPFGEIYGIVTKDKYRMIKVITKGDDEDTYTLISKPTDSKKDEFPNQQIKKSSILYLFKVQASSHLF